MNQEQKGPEGLSLRQKRERSGTYLNKRAVVAVTVAISLLVGFVVLSALSRKAPEEKKNAQSTAAARPSEALNALPNAYSDIKPTPTPKPLALPEHPEERASLNVPVRAEDATEKFLRDQALRHLKRRFEARESSLSFPVSGDALKEGSGGSKEEGGAGSPFSEASVNAAMPQDAASSSSLNPRDDDGRQDEKSTFLNTTRDKSTYLSRGLSSPISPYALQAGTIIPGVLLTGINSDLPGQISGQVSQNVYDSATGRYLLLPQGTKVIGEYDSRVVYGQERVLVVWTRLILPNADSISLEGMPGIDLSGYAGLSDQVNNHYLKLLSGIVFGSVLGATAQMAHGTNRYGNPDFEELALSGMAQNTNQAGQQITRKNLNIQPTLEIRPGFRFSVFVTKDIVLKPYNT